MNRDASGGELLGRIPAVAFVLRYRLNHDDYRFEQVSETCRDQLGVEPDPAVNMFAAIAGTKELTRIDAALRAAAHSHQRFECNFPLERPRDRLGWVRVVADPREDGASELVYTGLVVDASGQHQAYEHLNELLRSDRSQLRLTAATLRDSVRAIKDLQSQVGAISEQEQVRIGHDLHDGLGQELTATALLIRAIEHGSPDLPEDLARKIDALGGMVQRCLSKTKALAEVLSPVHMPKMGLAGGIQRLVANLEFLYERPIKCLCAPDTPGLDGDVEANLYRIAQEALINAAKHSGAKRIEVRLDTERARLRLEVEDDGVGLPREEQRGMGLKIMGYRANMVGAELEMIQKDLGGTLIRCTMQTNEL